ncbi:MAG: DEAD/DEAH box helicase family protein, partial [Clostridia bacterium]|nr:DEAD/DEAH box helicase family protein [Clostridia bacterium]
FDTEKLSKQDLESKISAWQGHDPASVPSSDAPKPWEKTMRFHWEDCGGPLRIVRANLVYIESENLKPRLQNQIRRLAAFSNPIYFRNKAIGLSNYANGRFIYLGEDDSGFIGIPRGLYEALTEKCRDAGIPFTVEDRRADGKQINVTFTGVLRDNQREAVEAMLIADCGILSAATAFGKTVVCCGLISELKTSTLILLESSSLISQWEKAISTFLKLDEELPEYTTKSGRVKNRSSLIGIIQGPKDTSTGIIDIAMVGSLCKKGEFHPRLKEYGLVLVDECHHSASETMREVLREIHAKHLYGVTATPFRSDGLEKINEMLLGPVRYRYTARQRTEEMGINCFVLPRFTRVVFPGGDDEKNIGKVYECLRDSEVRNEQIVCDIRDCIALGRTPVVLTKYVEHAKLLANHVQDVADHVFLLTGKQSSDERESLCEEMEQVAPSESLILVATGQLIGEGFDYPRLDTLIMAMPVAWKGIVEQYAGRLNRDYPGKKDVVIYDYVDTHIPVFDRMYLKRLKAYKRIGYQIASSPSPSPERETVHAIYDSDTYREAYDNDLLHAEKEIILSSPTLSRQKVEHVIALLRKRQEAGVNVVILTLHPDAYRFGRDETRLELMERLRMNGFHVELSNGWQQRYAVIDREIVWYGSMNLLSKEDVEDSIIRIAGRDVAAELLEGSFRKDADTEQFTLPLTGSDYTNP